MTTSLPVAKILIKYNSKSFEENDEEEKKTINIELTEQKAGPEIIKMLSTLDDQVYNKKTMNILIWLTSFKITKTS